MSSQTDDILTFEEDISFKTPTGPMADGVPAAETGQARSTAELHTRYGSKGEICWHYLPALPASGMCDDSQGDSQQVDSWVGLKAALINIFRLPMDQMWKVLLIVINE